MVPLWDHNAGRMNVVSHRAIRAFCEKHRDAVNPLDHWYRVAKRATWVSFPEVRQTFNMAGSAAPDIVLANAVFDIGGNKYRLIAEINFRSRLVFIRAILTHNEYLKGSWKT